MTQKLSDIVDITFRFIREFGFPTFVLIVIGYWVHNAAVSMHSTIVVPVVKSHTDFMEVTQETLKELGQTQEKQADTLQEICHSQREIVETIKKIAPSIGAPPK